MQNKNCQFVLLMHVFLQNYCMAELKEHFGKRLKYLRESKKLTQEQFAEVLGVSRQTVSRWETGAAVPDGEKIAVLCERLGVRRQFFGEGEANGVPSASSARIAPEVEAAVRAAPRLPHSSRRRAWRCSSRALPTRTRWRSSLRAERCSRPACSSPCCSYRWRQCPPASSPPYVKLRAISGKKGRRSDAYR